MVPNVSFPINSTIQGLELKKKSHVPINIYNNQSYAWYILLGNKYSFNNGPGELAL